MSNNLDVLISAINLKRVVKIKINNEKRKEISIRKAIPFDFGPSRMFRDGINRFHFYIIDGPDGQHNYSPIPEELISIELTEEIFDPTKYVTWKNPNWFVSRNW